jgi:hypothetical protein
MVSIVTSENHALAKIRNKIKSLDAGDTGKEVTPQKPHTIPMPACVRACAHGQPLHMSSWPHGQRLHMHLPLLFPSSLFLCA